MVCITLLSSNIIECRKRGGGSKDGVFSGSKDGVFSVNAGTLPLEEMVTANIHTIYNYNLLSLMTSVHAAFLLLCETRPVW